MPDETADAADLLVVSSTSFLLDPEALTLNRVAACAGAAIGENTLRRQMAEIVEAARPLRARLRVREPQAVSQDAVAAVDALGATVSAAGDGDTRSAAFTAWWDAFTALIPTVQWPAEAREAAQEAFADAFNGRCIALGRELGAHLTLPDRGSSPAAIRRERLRETAGAVRQASRHRFDTRPVATDAAQAYLGTVLGDAAPARSRIVALTAAVPQATADRAVGATGEPAQAWRRQRTAGRPPTRRG